MPIERKKKTLYAHDDVVEPEMSDDVEPIEGAEIVEESSEPMGDTATISLSILGGQSVNPGDKVTLEVVESSADDGTLTLKYPKKQSKGVAQAAAAFEEPMKGMV